MELIPEHIERAIESSVAFHLRAQLGARGLLLSQELMRRAERQTARFGQELLTGVVHQCYPALAVNSDEMSIEFEGTRHAGSVHAALAFGAHTATFLAQRPSELGRPADSVELLCALFNLGIGLVDGLVDESPNLGARLLGLLNARELITAAQDVPPPRWLAGRLVSPLADEPGAVFAADVIDAFFRLLHEVHPGHAALRLRRRAGAQLAAALEAEMHSVGASLDHAPLEQLIECSRSTSVLPFQIIQTLAGGEVPPEPGAGALLGEAMWRIDDLIDLCQDARRGALNGVLLAACAGVDRGGKRNLLAALLRLVDSPEIPRVTEEAAARLLEVLRIGGEAGAEGEDYLPILYFIQRYAGIEAYE